MAKITFRIDGKEIETNAINGETLLEVANRNGVRMYGACAGGGVCGSCRVLIENEFLAHIGQPSFEEKDLLESLPEYKPNLRLACGVIVSDKLDGMIVTVP